MEWMWLIKGAASVIIDISEDDILLHQVTYSYSARYLGILDTLNTLISLELGQFNRIFVNLESFKIALFQQFNDLKHIFGHDARIK